LFSFSSITGASLSVQGSGGDDLCIYRTQLIKIFSEISVSIY